MTDRSITPKPEPEVAADKTAELPAWLLPDKGSSEHAIALNPTATGLDYGWYAEAEPYHHYVEGAETESRDKCTRSLVVRACGMRENPYDDGPWIADCGDMSGREHRANARLIAAAPALFKYVQRKAIEGDPEARIIVDMAVVGEIVEPSTLQEFLDKHKSKRE